MRVDDDVYQLKARPIAKKPRLVMMFFRNVRWERGYIDCW